MPEETTPDSDKALAQIRSNAALVVESCNETCGFEFSFDARSVEWLDKFIEKLRSGPFSDQQRESMETSIGCYLGEAIVRAYGGEWCLDEKGWHILFPVGTRAFPFAKVHKRFNDGEFDSIESFFRICGEFAKPESKRRFTSAAGLDERESSGLKISSAPWRAILTDSHFLIPLAVFCIGLTLLITLH